MAAGEQLPLPPHFDPARIGEVWRVPYEERARAAEGWAREHGLPPASEDAFRVCLVVVDAQNTFCTPGFELFVAGRSGRGALDDSRRLCEFIYRNLHAITQIVPSLDTHAALQIFHAAYLVDAEGQRPAPYTLVSADDIVRGRWRVSPAACTALGLDLPSAQRQLLHYTRELEGGSKYQLTVWPYHALLGGIGHALVSSLEEAVFFHGLARESQPRFLVKGRSPRTEHYSMLGPEVLAGPDGKPLGEREAPLLQALLEFDALIVAGQAKSHCVAWTVDDLLRDETARRSGLAGKLYLLEDCASPVVVPGAVDYTDEADAAFRRFAEAGAHVVRSTEPIERWLRQPALPAKRTL